MLRITAAYCPELTNLLFWFYERDSQLITKGGHTVMSPTGTQQGCTLSNPLFVLVVEYISKKLIIPGIVAKLFYWDDTALVGIPEAIADAVNQIRLLSEETGLQLRWQKCHLYGLPDVIAKCNNVSPLLLKDNVHDNFDMIYLKAPIGSDLFVAEWLTAKLSKLQDLVTSITQMPYKH